MPINVLMRMHRSNPTEGYAEQLWVPPILAKHFELKHSLINMMTSDQFFGLEKDNPHDHIRMGPVNKISFIHSLIMSFNQFANNFDTFYNALHPTDQDSFEILRSGRQSFGKKYSDVVENYQENKSKRDSEGDIIVNLLNLDKTKDLPPYHDNPLSDSTTSSSPSLLISETSDYSLEKFANELAHFTFPPELDYLPLKTESIFGKKSICLNHDPYRGNGFYSRRYRVGKNSPDENHVETLSRDVPPMNMHIEFTHPHHYVMDK
ncbi:hypothetical protein Tco_1093722 [Tanacetum coccineum]|uniref:Reverse transcriptase domain-containing protein n=1 Tax=Tanacetum coccineum TaxID=301880 RepID=A0ABQ5IEV6_9ASTR